MSITLEARPNCIIIYFYWEDKPILLTDWTENGHFLRFSHVRCLDCQVSLIHITSWADRISSRARRKVGCFALYVWKYGWGDSVFQVRWNLSFVYLCSNRQRRPWGGRAGRSPRAPRSDRPHPKSMHRMAHPLMETKRQVKSRKSSATNHGIRRFNSFLGRPLSWCRPWCLVASVPLA